MYIHYVTLKGLHWAKILKAFVNQKLEYVIHRACIFDDVNKYETKIKKTAFWARKNKPEQFRKIRKTCRNNICTNNLKQAQKGPKCTVAN